nr:GAF domain-containing protein [uncultured Oscillibacter sp.]
MTDYELLNQQMAALVHNVPYKTASLANAAALLYHSLDGLNWAGFYLMEGGALVLGPFQGKPACIEIPVGRGVCGTAVAEDRTQLVRDVHRFPGHIACDCASKSEIVVPIHAGGQVVGVLDIDSPLAGRFTEEDQAGLEAFARILEREVWHQPEAPRH